ncbi:RcnB family protein [Pseudoxanthomonas sp.]|uniref:RcnB family protein n=1 Tax=Pseudoxanthomonas sp. TaxID=1871049 RepID=UPI002621A012|nr:RcnB family protein [Pseudoxanthomonas sp.]WDS35384.1 MAG: RcnB family protein [Pseudoxanthomonas sp.]
MKLISALILSASLCFSGAALAQQHDDHHDDGHKQDQHAQSHGNPHKKGDRLAQGSRGDRVPDYRKHGLKAPPKGHEWRKVDNDYVLIAVTTGIISSVIAASH